MKSFASGWFRNSNSNPSSPTNVEEAQEPSTPITPIQTAADYLSDYSDRDDGSRYFSQLRNALSHDSNAQSPVSSPKTPSISQTRSISQSFVDMSKDKYISGVLSSSTDDSSRAMWRSFSEEEISPFISSRSMGSKMSENRSPPPTPASLKTSRSMGSKMSENQAPTPIPAAKPSESREPDSQADQSQSQSPAVVPCPASDNANEEREDAPSTPTNLQSLFSKLAPTPPPTKTENIKSRPPLQLPRDNKFYRPEDEEIEFEGIEVVDGRLTKDRVKGLQNEKSEPRKSEQSMQKKSPDQKGKTTVPKETSEQERSPAELNAKESAKENDPEVSNKKDIIQKPNTKSNAAGPEKIAARNTPAVQRDPPTSQISMPVNKAPTGKSKVVSPKKDEDATKIPDDKPKAASPEKAAPPKKTTDDQPKAGNSVKTAGVTKMVDEKLKAASPKKSESASKKSLGSKAAPVVPEKTEPEREAKSLTNKGNKKETPQKDKGNQKETPPKNNKAKLKALGHQTKSNITKQKSKKTKKSSRKSSIPTEIVVKPEAKELPVLIHRPNRSSSGIITQEVETSAGQSGLDIINVAPAAATTGREAADNKGKGASDAVLNETEAATLKEYIRLRKKASQNKHLVPGEVEMENVRKQMAAKETQAPSAQKARNVVVEELVTCGSQADLGIIDGSPCLVLEDRKRSGSESNSVTNSYRNAGMVGNQRVLCNDCLAAEKARQGSKTKRDGSAPVKLLGGTSTKDQVCRNCLMNRTKKGKNPSIGVLDLSENVKEPATGRNLSPAEKDKSPPSSSKKENKKADGDRIHLLGTAPKSTDSASKINSSSNSLAVKRTEDDVAICLRAAEEDVHRVCSLFPKKLLGFTEVKTKSPEERKKPKKKRQYSNRRGQREPVPIKTIEFPLPNDGENGDSAVLSQVSSLTHQPPKDPNSKSVTWAAKLKQMQTESKEHEQKQAGKKKTGLGRFPHIHIGSNKPKQKILFEA